MFQNLLEKKHEINFFDYSNCHAFEIPNFLDDNQYNELNKNIPFLQKREAQELNDKFDDKKNQHQLKAYINELNKDAYNKFIEKNLILNEFANIFKNSKMNEFFF